MKSAQDNFWLRIIYIVSVVISAAVAFLILGPRPEGIEGALDVSALPMVNATLNSITTVLLVYGYILLPFSFLDLALKESKDHWMYLSSPW